MAATWRAWLIWRLPRGVEAVAFERSAGGVDGGGPVETGEVPGGGKAAHPAGVCDDAGGTGGADPIDLGDGGGRGGHGGDGAAVQLG